MRLFHQPPPVFQRKVQPEEGKHKNRLIRPNQLLKQERLLMKEESLSYRPRPKSDSDGPHTHAPLTACVIHRGSCD